MFSLLLSFYQLNQRLCEIRYQTASSAVMSLDTEFRHHLATQFDNDDLLEDPEEITKLRQQHAEDIFMDKKFMFGKYVVSCESGKVGTLSIQATTV